MKITKLYCPFSPHFWEPRMLKAYKMQKYSPGDSQDKAGPVVVFGCYGGGTKIDIMRHTGLCVIVWSGGDSIRLNEKAHFIQYCKDNAHRVFHIAHSHWIQTDLEHFGLKYIDRVVLPGDFSEFSFEKECGDSVYHYSTQTRSWYYGTDIVDKIDKSWRRNRHFPKIHKTNQNAYKFNELYELYKDSFIGIRLTEHDNMAMSVIEMGLMGRRSIFNGNVPCAIPYPCEPYKYEPLTKVKWVWQDESLLPVISKMILEYRGTEPDRILSQKMAEFVTDNEDWLDTKFYEG